MSITKKNILFIAVDDLRCELNCYGKKQVHTPNIDRLAASGLIFENAYCQIPLCMPSRTATLSGIRPQENYAFKTSDVCLNNEPTLPGHLKSNGYETISIGKIYHFNKDDEASWSRRYKDTFYEQQYVCDGYCSGYQLEDNLIKLRKYMRNVEDSKAVDNPAISECVDAPDNNYPDAKIAQIAVNELSTLKSSDKPFFLAVGFYRPHLPWAVPKKYWDLYNRDEIDLADNPFFPKDGIGKTGMTDFLHYGDALIQSTYSDLGHYKDDDFPILDEDKQRECIHGYRASVSFMDAQLGKVLTYLDSAGLTDSTTIVLWGDNGWHLGEHKLWSKVSTFEESTHIPMLISVPGITKGESTKALVELIDLYPTMCEVATIEKPAHLQGSGLMPLIKVPQRKWKKAIFSRIEDAYTTRSNEFRLTYYKDASIEGDTTHIPNSGQYELFDLIKDPKENINVANDSIYKDALANMKSILEKGWEDVQINI